MHIKKTGLYDIHVSLGAKMVEFAGFLMPIYYNSIIEEHKIVRNSVGVFDVSHMGQITIQGSRAIEFVNYLTINDASMLELNQAQYTAMCYPDGGIIDDLVCYRRMNNIFLVVNAANTQKDFEWIIENKWDDVLIENKSDDYTQLAIQGKYSEEILQELTTVDLSKIKFYWFTEGVLAGVDMIISRTGYTGEPGFEIYFKKVHSVEIWKSLFDVGEKYKIAPIGLGARDTLRMEKKYCLYGNDIDKTTTPLEAGLGWITKLQKSKFIGRDSLIKLKEEGIKRRLIGFVSEEKMIPRPHHVIEKDGIEVGFVTSGCFSPILGKNIGLGYVKIEKANIGDHVQINARGRKTSAEIVKTPFI
jgi:aminomethyltransferase